MKKSILLLVIFINFSLFASEPFVSIYKTHDNGLYGRSEDRDMLLTINDSAFARYETLPAEQEYDFLTGVVMDKVTVSNLEHMLIDRESIQIGFIKISKINNIYTIEDDILFLNFSFSLEKPSEQVIRIIEDHYKSLPEIKTKVAQHYKDNYLIRIHTAENILNPEAKEITYDEALIMATIIGDKEQWLWGIHDGKDYLKELLF